MNITVFDAETGETIERLMTQEEIAELKALSIASPPTVQDYQRAIQQLVEETAQSKQYDTAANLASYVASTVPVWAAQAQAFVAWRDDVWSYAYGELAKVQAGQREQPTVEEFLNEITPISWPSAE